MGSSIMTPTTRFTPASVKMHAGGPQVIYQFAYGYGASVIQNFYSYGGSAGLWELAVLYKGALCYTTPITDDVLGRLDDAGVDAALAQLDAYARGRAELDDHVQKM